MITALLLQSAAVDQAQKKFSDALWDRGSCIGAMLDHVDDGKSPIEEVADAAEAMCRSEMRLEDDAWLALTRAKGFDTERPEVRFWFEHEKQIRRSNLEHWVEENRKRGGSGSDR